MRPTPKSTCPGCHAPADAPLLQLPAEPVVLNYRYPSVSASLASVRAPLELAECRSCGLIYNAVLQPELIPYDERYENTQAHSPRFKEHLAFIISVLRDHYQLSPSSRIIEIGCGKGDFLKIVHELIGCGGVGYDTSYEGPASFFENKIQFHQRYFTLAEKSGNFDLIVCRHVIEHIPDIGPFLDFLAQISARYHRAPIILETPAFEWIAENAAFWDVFYEHCNYFTTRALRSLLDINHIEVDFQNLLFEGQYQLLGCRAKSLRSAKTVLPAHNPILANFASAFRRKLETLQSMIDRIAQGKSWGIWGAGAKGITLATRLPHPPFFLVDSNVKKQGCYVPGTGIPIVAPDDHRLDEASFILVANPAYHSEISALLEKSRRSVRLENLE